MKNEEFKNFVREKFNKEKNFNAINSKLILQTFNGKN